MAHHVHRTAQLDPWVLISEGWYYIPHAGCPWRRLPRGGFRLRSTVYNIFRDYKRDGAALVLEKIHNHFPWLKLRWADGVRHAHQVDAAVAEISVSRLEIIK